MTTPTYIQARTRETRETLWVHVRDNPYITQKRAAEYIGHGVQAYLYEMYKSRLMDRRESKIPAPNFAGFVHEYEYYVPEGTKYVPPSVRKPTRTTAPMALSPETVRAAAQAAQARTATLSGGITGSLNLGGLSREASGTSTVHQMIGKLPDLPVRDVMMLRNAINSILIGA